jgi:short-subunit dehydrogenase
MEVKPLGINVVAVCPGDVKTNFTKNRVKVTETNERYGDRIKNAAENIDSKEDKRMSPDVVGKKVLKIANKKNPKPLVIVGGKYKFFYFMKKILPTRCLHSFLYKYFGGFKKVKTKE